MKKRTKSFISHIIVITFLITLCFGSTAFADYEIWHVKTVNSSGIVGDYSNIAVAPDGTLGISYYDYSNANLMYASLTESTGYWVNEIVDGFGTVGKYTDLAFNSKNEPMISYYDQKNSRLKFAKKNLAAGTWQIETIDSATIIDNTTSNTAIAIKSDDSPSISFYNDTNGDMMYTSYDSTTNTWTTSTADATNIVGSHNALAIDQNNIPAVAYFDKSNTNLRYSKYNPDTLTWDTQTIDQSGYCGEYVSLAFNDNDVPAVSYFYKKTNDLRYAIYNSSTSSWDITTVDQTGLVGMHTSLIFEDNIPSISYFDRSNNDLKFATIDAQTGYWKTTTAVSSGKVGHYSSLAYKFGVPYISYHNDKTQDLDVAYREIVKTNPNKMYLWIDNGIANVNGEAISLDSPPTIVDGRTLVPVRFLAESLGGTVSWDDATRTVGIQYEGKNLTMVIDQPNDAMDVPPMIINNRTMVPVRYISETLGAEVIWYGDERKVEVNY